MREKDRAWIRRGFGLLMALLFGAASFHRGWKEAFGISVYFGVLTWVALVDWDERRIPWSAVLGTAVPGFFLMGQPIARLLLCLIIGATLLLLKLCFSLGGGDVALLVTGFWSLGGTVAYWGSFLAFLFCALWGFARAKWQRRPATLLRPRRVALHCGTTGELPFGPFLLLGFGIAYLYG